MVLKSHISNVQPEAPGIRPFSWLASVLLLVVVAGVQYLAYHWFIPAYLKRTGQPYLSAYLWVWLSLMGLVLALSLVLYQREGRPLAWPAFASRYRLAAMPGKDWLWALIVLVVAVGCYLGLSATTRWLGAFPVFSAPPLAPAELRPGASEQITQGIFFGMSVCGQWWVVVTYFTGWVCNILGEEFFYRGWLLPRQEQAFGKYAWLINGTLFTFQHWMQPFNFLAIWPGALFMAWVVQRRKNTWIGILQHGLMNFSLFVILVRWVIG
jgi:membrane protease YdiL (CAAX protease family)